MGLFHPLDDFKTAEMPKRELPFWKMIGPGAVLVGLSIGAGEIIIWPRHVAQHGAGMVWVAVIGIFIQLWINFEIGRWTIATGETCFTGYSRVWRGFAPIFILLTILGWLAPGWARASGLAIKALLVGPQGFGSDTFWTCCTFGCVALMLFGPKIAYKVVEKSIELMVVIVTLGMLTVAIVVGTSDKWVELLQGIGNVGHKPEGVTIKQMFIALVFAGAGGTSNLFYSFYLRDKHIGMGRHLPSMENPLRGRTETIPSTGFRYDETPENISRFRSWWDYIVKDQILFFWFLNTVTILLFIFGALAVLHANKLVPAEGQLIWDEAQVLKQVWGEPGRVLFLIVGVATLFSTQLALVDGVSRSIADILHTNFSFARARSVSWWYVLIASIWIIAGCAITYAMERGVSDLGFLFNAAYMGGYAMAIYVPLNLYINYRFLPKSARPGPFCTFMAVVGSVLYVGFALSCIWWEITSRLG